VTPLSKIEQLPVKVLFQLSSLLPLPPLFNLLSASRQLRCMHLGFEPDRDALALTWIQTTGVWCLTQTIERLRRRCNWLGTLEEMSPKWLHEEQAEDLGS
jgi:hypothetical protein